MLQVPNISQPQKNPVTMNWVNSTRHHFFQSAVYLEFPCIQAMHTARKQQGIHTEGHTFCYTGEVYLKFKARYPPERLDNQYEAASQHPAITLSWPVMDNIKNQWQAVYLVTFCYLLHDVFVANTWISRLLRAHDANCNDKKNTQAFENLQRARVYRLQHSGVPSDALQNYTCSLLVRVLDTEKMLNVKSIWGAILVISQHVIMQGGPGGATLVKSVLIIIQKNKGKGMFF